VLAALALAPPGAADLPRSAPVALVPVLGGRPHAEAQRRLGLSAWAFLRGGGTASLAPAGMLGGSQAGARATYRIAGRERPLSLSLRASAPLERPRGVEAAAGLDWRPLARVPAHLIVERRQRLGRDGRSAFGATLYGGGEAMLGPLRLDGYAQAGIVGLARRDLFADGAARAALPLGLLRVGAGAWIAAQPGLSRLDLGPHAALRLPRLHAALSADWRFRAAGNARPGSGPALTLAADF
jgi:hypothetical protein